MKVKSMRIPEDIEQAIEYVSKVEKIEKTQSLRKLARVGFEYYVAKAYREGKITFCPHHPSHLTSDLLLLNPYSLLSPASTGEVLQSAICSL